MEPSYLVYICSELQPRVFSRTVVAKKLMSAFVKETGFLLDAEADDISVPAAGGQETLQKSHLRLRRKTCAVSQRPCVLPLCIFASASVFVVKLCAKVS